MFCITKTNILTAEIAKCQDPNLKAENVRYAIARLAGMETEGVVEG
jgi:hypothetical protein